MVSRIFHPMKILIWRSTKERYESKEMKIFSLNDIEKIKTKIESFPMAYLSQ